MSATEFNPAEYEPETLALIMTKANEWQCTPNEAMRRLLNDLARRRRPKAA